MYILWAILVVAAVINVTDINNYGYQNIWILALSVLGCFSELLRGYNDDNKWCRILYEPYLL